MTVENQDGTKVSGATVEATFADGRTDEGTTDGNGTVVLYLPNGKSVVQCTYEHMEEEEEVTVDEAPETVEFLLEEGVRVFYDMINLYEYQDMVESMILSAYPNAIDYEYFDFEASEAFKIELKMYGKHLDSGGNVIIHYWQIRLLILSKDHWEEIGYTSRYLQTASRQLSTSYDSGQELLIEYQVRDFGQYGNNRTVDEKIYVSDTRAYDDYYDFTELRNDCMKSFEPRLLSDFESELRRLSVEIERIIEEQYK